MVNESFARLNSLPRAMDILYVRMERQLGAIHTEATVLVSTVRLCMHLHLRAPVKMELARGDSTGVLYDANRLSITQVRPT